MQRLHVIQNKQILYTVKNKDIEYNWGLDVKESRSESKGVMQRLECKTIQVIFVYLYLHQLVCLEILAKDVKDSDDSVKSGSY